MFIYFVFILLRACSRLFFLSPSFAILFSCRNSRIQNLTITFFPLCALCIIFSWNYSQTLLITLWHVLALCACALISFFSRSTALAVLQEDILMCRISFFIFVCALFFLIRHTRLCGTNIFFFNCPTLPAFCTRFCACNFELWNTQFCQNYRTNIVPYQYRTVPISYCPPSSTQNRTPVR